MSFCGMRGTVPCSGGRARGALQAQRECTAHWRTSCMLLLRAVHRPPGSMVRSACYGSSSGVKSPSRRLLVRCEEAEADVCDETHNSFPDVCGVRSPAHASSQGSVPRSSEIRRGEFLMLRNVMPAAGRASAKRSAPGSKRQTYYVHTVLQSWQSLYKIPCG